MSGFVNPFLQNCSGYYLHISIYIFTWVCHFHHFCAVIGEEKWEFFLLKQLKVFNKILVRKRQHVNWGRGFLCLKQEGVPGRHGGAQQACIPPRSHLNAAGERVHEVGEERR